MLELVWYLFSNIIFHFKKCIFRYFPSCDLERCVVASMATRRQVLVAILLRAVEQKDPTTWRDTAVVHSMGGCHSEPVWPTPV